MDQQREKAKKLLDQMRQEELELNQNIGRFHLALTLTKYCARNCDVFKDLSGQLINDKETSCLKTCAENIGLTFPRFYDEVRSSLSDMD